MKFSQLKGIATDGNQALRSLAIAEFMKSFPLADIAEFYKMIGNADSPRKAQAVITAGSNRTIDTAYTAKKNTPGFAAVALKIYGDVVETDIAHVRRGEDVGDQRANDLAVFANSLGRYFMASVINDTLSATKFSGLKEQATELSRKFYFDTSNGGTLPAGNGNTERKQQHKFIEFLQMYIAMTQANALILNATLIARLASIGREYMTVTSVKDIYGAEQKVTMFDNVPLVNAGYDAANTSFVIGNTETEGSNSDCTSIYAVKFSEKSDVTFATNCGLDVRDLGQVGTKQQTMVEFDCDMAVLNDKSFARLSGIRLNA